LSLDPVPDQPPWETRVEKDGNHVLAIPVTDELLVDQSPMPAAQRAGLISDLVNVNWDLLEAGLQRFLDQIGAGAASMRALTGFDLTQWLVAAACTTATLELTRLKLKQARAEPPVLFPGERRSSGIRHCPPAHA